MEKRTFLKKARIVAFAIMFLVALTVYRVVFDEADSDR